MKHAVILVILAACVALFVTPSLSQNKYVGAKACLPCHKSDKAGKQADIWQKSKHASAMKTLATPAAAEVAKKAGVKGSPAEAAECVSCHSGNIDAKLADKAFDLKDGVQCESCHGPGSAYKAMNVMKDHAKSVAAGLTDYKDEAAIEKQCKTCHNEKSPTFKGFEFKKMWDQIKHPTPKS